MYMEEIKGNEVKENYVNRETLEVLTDSFDISYYKNLQDDEIFENLLLGEFNKLGDYAIKKEILLELVSAKKYIKEAKDNKYILSAPVKSGMKELTFTLQIESEGNKKNAVLRLIEKDIKIDLSEDLLKTVIARYKDDDDIYFLIKVKKIFNIVDDSDGKDINNEEILNIILKKLQDFKLLKTQSNKFEDLSKVYIEKIIGILKDNPGKFSEYVLRQYGFYLESMKDSIGKQNYYRLLKIKLDRIIDEANKNNKDLIINPLILEARKQFLNENKQIQDDILIPKPVIVKAPVKEKPQAPAKKVEEVKKAVKKDAPKKKVEEKKKEKKEDEKKYPAFVPQETEKTKKQSLKLDNSDKKPDKEVKNPDKNNVNSGLLLSEVLSSQVVMTTNALSKTTPKEQQNVMTL